MGRQRKIIHIDADCFYAAVEMRDNPKLVGKPIAVGGEGRRGVISTCNYEARAYGIHSAMPGFKARELCPHITFVPHRMQAYKEASAKIREIFLRFTDVIEPLSLDEAFLDVTHCDMLQGSATLIAETIRQMVKDEVNLVMSAGVAPNKFLAKIASDWEKPDGLYVITPNKVEAFVKDLPVGKIFGVGKKSAARLNQFGLYTCGDVYKLSLMELVKRFGSMGETLYRLSRGIDDRPVATRGIRKSLSCEHTYSHDVPDVQTCLEKIPDLFEELTRRLGKQKSSATINKSIVKLKFNDFTQTTIERSETTPNIEFFQTLCKEAFERGKKPVRLIGLGVRFKNQDIGSQLELFDKTDIG